MTAVPDNSSIGEGQEKDLKTTCMKMLVVLKEEMIKIP